MMKMIIYSLQRDFHERRSVDFNLIPPASNCWSQASHYTSIRRWFFDEQSGQIFQLTHVSHGVFKVLIVTLKRK